MKRRAGSFAGAWEEAFRMLFRSMCVENDRLAAP